MWSLFSLSRDILGLIINLTNDVRDVKALMLTSKTIRGIVLNKLLEINSDSYKEVSLQFLLPFDRLSVPEVLVQNSDIIYSRDCCDTLIFNDIECLKEFMSESFTSFLSSKREINIFLRGLSFYNKSRDIHDLADIHFIVKQYEKKVSIVPLVDNYVYVSDIFSLNVLLSILRAMSKRIIIEVMSLDITLIYTLYQNRDTHFDTSTLPNLKELILVPPISNVSPDKKAFTFCYDYGEAVTNISSIIKQEILRRKCFPDSSIVINLDHSRESSCDYIRYFHKTYDGRNNMEGFVIKLHVTKEEENIIRSNDDINVIESPDKRISSKLNVILHELLIIRV